MDTIVVGLDGSKGAQAAARWAAAQARQNGSRIIAVYAVPRTELWGLSAVQVNIDKVLTEFHGLLDDKWSTPLHTADIAYTTQVVRGDPATELLRVAKKSKATMLILGSKSHTKLADMIVGGTVHKVINRSTLPVVLIPAAPKPKRPAPRKSTPARPSK